MLRNAQRVETDFRNTADRPDHISGIAKRVREKVQQAKNAIGCAISKEREIAGETLSIFAAVLMLALLLGFMVGATK